MKKSAIVLFVSLFLLAGISVRLYAQNLINNPGIETGGGWLFTPLNVSASSFEYHGGNNSAYLHPVGNDTALLGQCVSGLQAGKRYEFEYWVKADSISNYLLPFVRFACDTGNVFDTYFCPNSNVAQWTRVFSRFIVPQGADSLIFYFALFHSGKLWLDDFSLTEITDTTWHNYSINTQQTAGQFTDVFNANGIGPGDPAAIVNHIQKFQEAGIRYIRTHDYQIAFDYHIIFPDTSQSALDPTAYHFHTTDSCIAGILNAGGKVYYRFGESYSNLTQYAVPPCNKQKFADVCLQIIKHYNAGWDNGFHYGLDYFEIWNEPDLQQFWRGNVGEYLQLYAATANKIKQYDASLHVGGPAMSNIYDESFIKPFLDTVSSKHLPLDFFSYHLYYLLNPYYFKLTNEYARAKLHSYGLDSTELINSEWNSYLYSFDTPSTYGMDDALNAASAASAMTYMQESSIGKMIRYAFDNWWFGMVDWMDNWCYAGWVFKSFHEMADNNMRLSVSGADSSGSTILASINNAGSVMYAMISDNSSASHGYHVTLNGLVSSNWSYTVYRLDANHLLTAVDNGNISQGNAMISEKVYPPFVDYIVFQLTTDVASDEVVGFSLFPVPAKDQVWITQKNNSDFSVGLYDISGKLIDSYQFSNGRGNIPLQHIPAGIYSLKITNEKGAISIKKIVVSQ
jgi:xylan 1,4-beta-xylosidase